MIKDIKELQISTSKGEIALIQENPWEDNDDVIVISPYQVDLLIDWLKEARASLCQKAK